ncbi:MAG: hypothetical protein ACYC2R_08855 [Burkholderiales bacterium]
MPYTIKFASPLLGLVLLFISMQTIGALPGESIVLDPSTGDYTITYWDYPGDPDARIRQAVFVPATKIDPLVKSTFKLREGGTIFYTYRVTNGVKSRQPLIAMLFDPVTDIVSAVPLPKRQQDVDLNTIAQTDRAGVAALATPDGWIGRSTTSRAGGLRIGWSYEDLNTDADGLASGKKQSGFGFSSKDLPGIGIAQLDGNAPVPMFPAEGPADELAKEFEPIEQNNFVSRNAAIPTIAVPNPFDPAVLLERIQTHAHTWIARKLLDPAFSAQLDRFFLAAVNAYRSNQPEAARKSLKAMREYIKQEHADSDREDDGDDKGDDKEKNKSKQILIDKLAARILDFDLKYVMKRMDGDDTRR